MIVVLTEEPSSAEMLKRVIPKILPDMLPQLDLQIVEHRGIGDLKAKLPSLLRGWPGRRQVHCCLRPGSSRLRGG